MEYGEKEKDKREREKGTRERHNGEKECKWCEPTNKYNKSRDDDHNFKHVCMTPVLPTSFSL